MTSVVGGRGRREKKKFDIVVSSTSEVKCQTERNTEIQFDENTSKQKQFFKLHSRLLVLSQLCIWHSV